jgi:pSer/pThr/pTyr-binding forkhead associated (FHA) protein
LITCSRCGKENQDHYKFCLGCGAKLEAAAAAAPKSEKLDKPEKPSVPLSMAKTALPQSAINTVPGDNGARAATAAAPGSVTAPGTNAAPGGAMPGASAMPAAAPAAGATAARRNDAIANSVTAAGVLVGPSASAPARAPAPAAATAPAPAPSTRLTGAGALPPSTGTPAVRPLMEPPAPGMVPPPSEAVPLPGPTKDTVICPKCGKTVGAAYAFCGACGQRLKPAGASAGAGAGAGPASGSVPRTMFMAPQAKPSSRGHLTLIRPDGTEGGMHPLHDGENLIGRGQGSLFDADPYLSPRHAEFVLTDEGLMVRDLRSLNGVFIKISQEEKLESGDIFRIGQELLRFDLIAPAAPLEDGTEIIGTPNPGYWGRISVIVGRDVDGPAFPLFDESIVLGRERGDILFPEDGYVSGTHAQITLREGSVFLSDLGSSNGTFFRLRGGRVVPPGSLILMGQQLFRVAYR